ncbi:hypothetical protein [Prosthecomicrobium sp. N25]|uniref:hypothetical protein n=1 Tax=Prosthecomicrobium sp. N25 TaxID=3129254 RepID=UPI003078651F
MSEPVSQEAFAAIVADRGLALSGERFEEFRTAYQYVLAVRERIRTPRGYDAEPASVFRAKEF